MQVVFNVNPKLLLNILWGSATILIILGTIVAVLLAFTPYRTALGLIPFFNMDLELTITSYYTSLIMIITTLLLLLITQDRKNNNDIYWRHWLGLALGFLSLSADESASIHEFVANIPRHYLHITAPINFAISILGLIVSFILILVYFKFLLLMLRSQAD